MRHRIFLAEAIGTFILVIGGPGSAVLATGGFFKTGSIGVFGVAFAFGLALLISAYVVGPTSGCHINPAVTLGLWLHKKVDSGLVPAYLAGQIIGAVVAGGVIAIIASTVTGFDLNDKTFAVNGWGNLSPGGFGFAAMVIIEILMTALLVFVVLSTFQKGFHPVTGGLVIGLTLTLIHLVSIPIDNTSVNPVRSLAMAVYARGDALQQLWAFIVFPLVGGAVGYAAWKALRAEDAVSAPDATL